MQPSHCRLPNERCSRRAGFGVKPIGSLSGRRRTSSPELATRLLAAGVESPGLIELAGLVRPTYWAAAPVLARVFEESVLPPIDRPTALWRLAYANRPGDRGWQDRASSRCCDLVGHRQRAGFARGASLLRVSGGRLRRGPAVARARGNVVRYHDHRDSQENARGNAS